MAVKIPVGADVAGIAQSLRQIRDAIRAAGQEAREFAKLDLSHPELARFADDITAINRQLQQLTAHGRGASGDIARQLYNGSVSSLFGPGGLAGGGINQLYADPQTAGRHQGNILRYLAANTTFQPPPPPNPMMPPIPGGGPGVPGGGGGGGGAGGGAAGALGSILPMLGRFVPQVAMATAAMAGVQRLGSMASDAVNQAGEEARANDTLLRTLRDLNADFGGLRGVVRDTSFGLGLTYIETQRLAASYAQASGSTTAAQVGAGTRLGAGFARGYGMDPGQVVSGFGRAAFLGDDGRRFATILADAIQQSGMTSRPGEVMETMLRFQEQNARNFGAPGSLDLFAGAYATLSSSGIPGLRGAGAESLLGRINSAVMQGGAAGDASQFLTYRALGRHGVTDPYQIEYALAGGMFGGVNGEAAGEGNPTIFEAMMGELDRLYPNNTREQRFRRFHAIGRQFGISPTAARALIEARGAGGFRQLGGALSDAGIDVGDVNPTAFRDLAEISAPGADLGMWRRRVQERMGRTDPRRAGLDNLNGEDLRRELIRIVARTGREENEGSRLQQSFADLNNNLTRAGSGLIPVLSDLRSVLAEGIGKIGDFTEALGDTYLALVHGDQGAIDRLAARRDVAAGYLGLDGGGGGAGGWRGTGVAGGTGSAGGAEQRARAREAYDYFVAQGWSPQAASGLVAQIGAESSFNPSATHDGGIGFGILGWNRDRLEALGRFLGPGADGRPRDPRSATYQEQLRFMQYELTEGRERARGDALRNLGTAGAAGNYLSRAYVRPKARERAARERERGAEEWMREFNPRPAAAGGEGGLAPGQQSSLRFDPLRVIVENERGDRIGESFLGLEPGTGGGAPAAWGLA